MANANVYADEAKVMEAWVGIRPGPLRRRAVEEVAPMICPLCPKHLIRLKQNRVAYWWYCPRRRCDYGVSAHQLVEVGYR